MNVLHVTCRTLILFYEKKNMQTHIHCWNKQSVYVYVYFDCTLIVQYAQYSQLATVRQHYH